MLVNGRPGIFTGRERIVCAVVAGEEAVYRVAKRMIETRSIVQVEQFLPVSRVERGEGLTTSLKLSVDLIIVLTDFCSHGASVLAAQQAKKIGIPLINGGRKWSPLARVFTAMGIRTHKMPGRIPAYPSSPLVTVPDQGEDLFPSSEPPKADTDQEELLKALEEQIQKEEECNKLLRAYVAIEGAKIQSAFNTIKNLTTKRVIIEVTQEGCTIEYANN